MGWLFKERATVKKYLPEKGKQKACAFVVLVASKREVYVGADVLSKAKITSLTPGQTVKLKCGPSDSKKHPGSLKATVISA